jgi:hypothetical protein
MKELENDPATKRLTMQMMATEGGGKATVEALMNRVSMIRQKVPGYSIKDELRSGFYGPINRGAAERTAISAAAAAKYQKQLEEVGAGSDIIQGRTDQGTWGDPNAQGPGRVTYPGMSRSEIYNFWKGSRRGKQFTYSDTQRFAEEQEKMRGTALRGETAGGGGGSIRIAPTPEADRQAIDANSGRSVSVEGSGTLTANINAPRGTTATMSGDGLFKKTIINRQTQMEPATEGPATFDERFRGE